MSASRGTHEGSGDRGAAAHTSAGPRSGAARRVSKDAPPGARAARAGGGGRRPTAARGAPSRGARVGGARVADARVVAWRIVRAVHRDGAWTGPAVDRALTGSGLDARDRAFASNLAFETLRWEGTLDWALGHAVRRPLDQVEADLLDVLRVGAWQLLYGRMPDRAAVSATVEVARAELAPRTVGFVNGVLRALARTRDDLAWPPESSLHGRALRTGYPQWVVRAADERFGSRADAELRAGNEPPGLTVRAADADDLAAALTAAGAQVRRGVLVDEALHVTGIAPGELLQRFPSGTIQDEASMVVGRVVDAAAPDGARILDACAAPGGKSVHLAALGRSVTAADRNPARLRLVGELAERLGLPLDLVAADGRRPAWRNGEFGGVLVDAPCSGLGVVRRRPDLRWNRQIADVANLAAVQSSLLEAAARAVAPGGALVYSVCTWTRAETVDVVTSFLDRHREFVAEPPEWRRTSTTARDRSTADRGASGAPREAGDDLDAQQHFSGDPGLQLTPDRHGTDGMYLAVLRRAEARA